MSDDDVNLLFRCIELGYRNKAEQKLIKEEENEEI